MATKDEKKKADEKRATVKIRAIDIQEMHCTIVGRTPLLQHRFDEKSKAQIRDKKAGGGRGLREKCDPEAECERATYRLSTGEIAFPVTAIKRSMFSAAHRDLGVTKVLIQQTVFIRADEGVLVRVNTSGSKMREDIVRVGPAKAPDLRYRPEMDQWSIDLHIDYDSERMSTETILNLLERAGFGVGIGEWRPEKGGEHGRFQVSQGKSKGTPRTKRTSRRG
jgi:hypothetical protein